MRKQWLGFGLALLIGMTVAVSDAATAVVSATETSGTDSSTSDQRETPAYSTAGNATFTVDGAECVVTENLNPNKYPVDFTETQVECKGRSYKGLKSDVSDIEMICLLNQSTGTAAYYIYRDADQSVYPFIKIENGNDYIIAMPEYLTEDTQVPAGYTQTELEFEKGKAQVYQSEDAPGAYLIYAMDSTGQKNWYEYHTEDKTYREYVSEPQQETGKDTVTGKTTGDVSDEAAAYAKKYEEMKKELKATKEKYSIVIAVMVILIVVLLFLLVNTILKDRTGRQGREDVNDRRSRRGFRESYEQSRSQEDEEDLFGEFEEETEIADMMEEEIPPQEEKTVQSGKKTKNYESGIEILDLNDL